MLHSDHANNDAYDMQSLCSGVSSLCEVTRGQMGGRLH